MAGKGSDLWSAIEKLRRDVDPAELPEEDIVAGQRSRAPGRKFRF